MAGIHTSNITSAANNGDVTIDPNGSGKTKIKSVNSTNPGATPLATVSDGEVKALKISDLTDIADQADDDDWLMIQDISDGNKIKKIKASEVLGGGGGIMQPDYGGPIPGSFPWLDVDSVLAVKAGGPGSTAQLQNALEFAVETDVYDKFDKNVVAGNQVKLRWGDAELISAAHGQTISSNLYAKSGSSYSQIFSLLINKQPTSWAIPPIIGAPKITAITSSSVSISGLNAPSPVTIGTSTLGDVEFSINGGPFVTTGNIRDGQTIQIKGTTGNSDSTGYTSVISIGGLPATWSVTTAAAGGGIVSGSIYTPADSSTNIRGSDGWLYIKCNTPVASGSASADNAVWELKRSSTSGTNVSGFPKTVNGVRSQLESTYVQLSDLSNSQLYYARVTHNDTSNGISGSPSPWISFTTSSSWTIEIGDEYPGGGYLTSGALYIGNGTVPGNEYNTQYFIIMAPIEYEITATKADFNVMQINDHEGPNWGPGPFSAEAVRGYGYHITQEILGLEDNYSEAVPASTTVIREALSAVRSAYPQVHNSETTDWYMPEASEMEGILERMGKGGLDPSLWGVGGSQTLFEFFGVWKRFWTCIVNVSVSGGGGLDHRAHTTRTPGDTQANGQINYGPVPTDRIYMRPIRRVKA